MSAAWARARGSDKIWSQAPEFPSAPLVTQRGAFLQTSVFFPLQYILSGSDDFNLYMWKIPKDPEAGEFWSMDGQSWFSATLMMLHLTSLLSLRAPELLC